MELTLEPDGSAHVSVTEGLLDAASLSYLTGWEVDAESWAMDGENVLVTAPSGAVLTLTPEEDALCARQQGATLRFVRPEAVTSVAIRTDATLEDFAGSWTAVSIAMGGMEMSTDMLGMYMSADIEGQRHHPEDRRWRPRQRDAAFIRRRVHGRAGGRRADRKNGTGSDG